MPLTSKHAPARPGLVSAATSVAVSVATLVVGLVVALVLLLAGTARAQVVSDPADPL